MSVRTSAAPSAPRDWVTMNHARPPGGTEALVSVRERSDGLLAITTVRRNCGRDAARIAKPATAQPVAGCGRPLHRAELLLSLGGRKDFHEDGTLAALDLPRAAGDTVQLAVAPGAGPGSSTRRAATWQAAAAWLGTAR
jgi:hypothetical protein